MTGTITTAFPLSFKAELPQKVHDFTQTTGDDFKLALIIASPTGTYNKNTANYSELVANSDEVPNGSGYTTGGFDFTPADNITPAIDGNKAIWQWSVDPQFAAATFSTSGCIIYNASKGNRVVYVGSFGGVVTVTASTLNLNMPTLSDVTALLRIGPSS